MALSAGERRRTRSFHLLGPTIAVVAIIGTPARWWSGDLIGTAIITGSAVLLFSALLARVVARPIERRLHTATEALASIEDERARLPHELELRVGQRTSELIDANRRLQVEVARRSLIEIELRHAQKLEAVGTLAAGIAHEINTPVQFVSDSCAFLETATADLIAVIAAYRATLGQLDRDPAAPATRAAAVRVKQLEAEREVTYLLEQIPLAIARSLQGLRRVAAMVHAMREFAHHDGSEQTPADLNRAILNTITVARNQYKYVADVTTELADLPPITCHIGELNQVILNMLVNAADAIASVKSAHQRDGLIVIRTRAAGSSVEVEIEDNGCGIPPSAMGRIFDPFFTTKEIGKGTGQGLALAHAVVVEKHAGKIDVTSRVGFGTTFAITLPVHGHEDCEPTLAAAAS